MKTHFLYLSLISLFIGIDWFSTNYPDYIKGEGTINKKDIWTRTNYKDGNFADVGKVHFSNQAHLLELFKKFKTLSMTHKILFEAIPENNYGLATWNFVVEKNE